MTLMKKLEIRESNNSSCKGYAHFMCRRRRPPESSLPRVPPLLALIKKIKEHERYASGRVQKTERKGKTRMIKRGAKNGWDVHICALYS